ncbi:MAG: response regulator [Planctomycetes bacterium]|nr:response regulator [Planctomycetota bacterium]
MTTHEPTVFVVDDDPVVRQMICARVQATGWPTQGYGTAEAFLDTYEPGKPACLVLDVELPGMNGFGLLQRLRARGCDLPVIMMSGLTDAHIAGHAESCGAFAFRNKRELADPRVLLDCIRQALAQRVAG